MPAKDSAYAARREDNFFNHLFAHCDGKIELRALPSKRRSFFPIDDYGGIADFCDKYSKENLYFGVATRDGQGGRKDNIIHIPAVWCDVDFKETPKDELGKNLKCFPFKPSIIILSGGGSHLYWLLKEPVGKEDIPVIEDVNRRIALSIGGDMGSVDAAHILRVPGTTNWKYPAPVKLHRLDKFYYELEDFEALPEAPNRTINYSNNGIDGQRKKILNCDFVKWCQESPADVPEPLWFALLSNLSCVRPGGYTLCHELSKGYPNYTREETDKKMFQVMDGPGPHTCDHINGKSFKCKRRCGVKAPVGLLRVTNQCKRSATDEYEISLHFERS